MMNNIDSTLTQKSSPDLTNHSDNAYGESTNPQEIYGQAGESNGEIEPIYEEPIIEDLKSSENKSYNKDEVYITFHEARVVNGQ